MSNTISLTKSAVVFDPTAHTYDMDGRSVSGITPIIKWCFPETYGDIPEAVLLKAAERGKSIHLDCQMADAGMPANSHEAQEYLRLKRDANLTTLTNEWLVDDGKDVASSIDVVNTDYSIIDIKATSKIHTNNVTLQLSIYAWLLERMNPGLQVPAIYVIWLPRAIYGQCALLPLERIAPEICEKVVQMYLDYVNFNDYDPLKTTKEDAAELAGISYTEARKLLGIPIPKDGPADTPDDLKALEQEYLQLNAEAEAAKVRMEEIKSIFQARLQESGEKKYDWDSMTVSYVAEKTSQKFDSTKFKKEHSDLYSTYLKESTSKAYVQIKIKESK